MVDSPATADDVLAQLGHRGQRPLSLLDQVERGTLDLELAAWLVSQITRGASFIIGARPGRAGKTTTMRALLDFVPGSRPYAIVLPEEDVALDGQPGCAVAHEISNHRVPGYLWGKELRAFFALSQAGHMLAANLHADDLAEARAQIVEASGVPEPHFRAAGLMIFLRVQGEGEAALRTVESVYYSDGATPHLQVFSAPDGWSADCPRDALREDRYRQLLAAALADGLRTVEAVRGRFLEWESGA
jgi:hypothetical protein